MSLQDSKQISQVKILLKTGVDGSGIASIEKTGSSGLVDTYTITLDDGRKTTFEVTNGEDGNGIASIAKTGTQGLVDTYTITMDDGSTYNFTVTNGRDGGMSTMFYITSDAGSTVTVTTPSGTVITATQVAGSTTEWEAATVEYGVHTITSVYGGLTQSTTVDVTEAKIYTVHLEHFIATITVTYPTGATCTCVGSSESYTATTNPYTFTVHNADTYTITATDGTNTDSETVIITTSGQSENITLDYTRTIQVDIYSAANDTVSYTGIDGQTHTITMDSTGHAQSNIDIVSNGSSLTFSSIIAKNPNNLSSDYSKTITVTTSTSSIYVMPDNPIYWYGFEAASISSTDYRRDAQSSVTAYTPRLTKNSDNLRVDWSSSIDNNSRCGTIFFDNSDSDIQQASNIKCIVEKSDINVNQTYVGGIYLDAPYSMSDLYTSETLTTLAGQLNGNIIEYPDPTLVNYPYNGEDYIGLYVRASNFQGTMYAVVDAIWIE